MYCEKPVVLYRFGAAFSKGFYRVRVISPVPIDNSASERSIRTFCVGKKNWVLINSVKGAQASAVIYSITETAKLNELNPYYYIKYLLERIPELMNAEGAIAAKDLEPLLPWSESLPAKCHRIRR